jgi:hypothetical protein
VWLINGMAMVRVVGGWLTDFCDPWCRDATGMVVGKIDFVAEVMLDGGWEDYIAAEVVAANNEGCGCVPKAEGWH